MRSRSGRLASCWSNHSRTIIGLTVGAIIIAASRWYWPKGGADFDVCTIIGAILLGFGLQGVLDGVTREINRPED